MQHVRFSVAFLIGVVTFLFDDFSHAQTPAIRIMPLGDSITYGSPVPGGYRDPLYHMLTNVGYNVDFVGSQTGNGVSTLPDSDHEGHGGWTIDGLRGSILSWFEAINDPHVILLHIGTNDSYNDPGFSNAVARLDALVTTLAVCQPSARVVVTSLMKRNGSNYGGITNYFNPYIPGLVAAQAAKGRRVSYLDMHAYLELSDMADGLHPNAGGYAKMAAAWLGAITNLVATNAVTANQPALLRAAGASDYRHVSLTLNKKVSFATATNTANYAVNNGLAVTAAALSADQRVVTLTTSEQAKGTTYTVTVNNVADETEPTALAVPADSRVAFIALTPRGYVNNVPGSSAYSLVYSLDLPGTADYYNNMPAYSTDNSDAVGPFSRVAYYLELQSPGGDLQYVWASMDAFTNRADKLGVPTAVSGAVYQRQVSNLRVFSNVAGVSNGTFAVGGNLEFWPTDYSEGNAAGIPDASGGTFDFGDARSGGGKYASMQVHNFAAKQTLFAINNWGGGGGNLCLGIGNQPSGSPDWTFNQNGLGYTVRTLQVLVLKDSGRRDATAPSILSAQAGSAGNLVTVAFDEPLASPSVVSRNFGLDHGVEVLSASLFTDRRTVRLTTTRQPADVALTLTVGGVRDRAANAVPQGTTVAVAPAGLPRSLAANVGGLAAGYQLIYVLEIPGKGNFNASADPYLYNQSGLAGAFDRVAYYVELVKPSGVTQYLWAAMDPFTDNKKKLGVPTFASGAIFQQAVTNLDVKSNVGGVLNGFGFTGGNLEFWPLDYVSSNAMGVVNASSSTCDFGDARAANGNYGSMQIHNAGASQTLFALNHWGSDGNPLCLGIGNQSAGNPDWTFADNAAVLYARRTLYVLVRPSGGPAPALPAEIAANAGALADGFRRVYTLDIPVTGTFNSALGAYAYAACRSSETFDRIAYYVELVKSGGETQYLWAAMDAFTNAEAKIGVPTLASGAVYQRAVSNLDVKSNVAGVQNGTGMSGGNLEFWPYNYDTTNALGIVNASHSTYDFGDKISYGGHHGSMQIHNAGASQTLFAMNNWGDDGNAIAIGIGNQPTDQPDWTFANNAGSYTRRTMHVLVRPTAASTPDPRQVPDEVAANVPEAAADGWQLAYVIDLPASGNFSNNAAAYYTVNNLTNGLATSFSRVAYYLALQSGAAPTQYVWTAMDAFTADAAKLGVPTGNTVFQQRLTRLDVKSNVDGIVAGSGMDSGNIEFWPYNYGPENAAGIPNANAGKYDFGDSCSWGANYGSMQIHNCGASQTLFAVNAFNGQTLCVGIGNNTSGTGDPDWTFNNNAGGYSYRRLCVFVLPGGETGDLSRPTVYTVVPSKTLNRIAVTFSETLADGAENAAFFALNNGASVTGASLAADKRTVLLTTTALTAGQNYLLSVTGVRDRSPNGNPIVPGSSVSFTVPTATWPAVLNSVPEASQYELVCRLAIATSANYSTYGCPYSVDESLYPLAHPFDRVAYCLELSANGASTNWVYVSMDAFTGDLAKIGVPTAPRGAAFQTYVNNMNVFAAAGANVTTGTGITTGNIEFWPSNYGTGNGLNIPGASGAAFDFGDSGFNATAGHGSMQIHNYAAGETILAFNQYGPFLRTVAVGIGNNADFSKNATPYPDWTFAENAGSYSVKNIYVLARWGDTPTGLLTGTRPEIWSQPQPVTILAGRSALLSVYAPDATAYQWRKNGAWIAGATQSWLSIDPAACSDGGQYDVLVYGSGSAYSASEAATLRVYPQGTVFKLR